jgi:hypothetical protein
MIIMLGSNRGKANTHLSYVCFVIGLHSLLLYSENVFEILKSAGK